MADWGAPQPGSIKAEYGFRPSNRSSMAQRFFRLLQAQGRSSDTPGIPQNASGPVDIPLKKAPGARQWT